MAINGAILMYPSSKPDKCHGFGLSTGACGAFNTQAQHRICKCCLHQIDLKYNRAFMLIQKSTLHGLSDRIFCRMQVYQNHVWPTSFLIVFYTGVTMHIVILMLREKCSHVLINDVRDTYLELGEEFGRKKSSRAPISKPQKQTKEKREECRQKHPLCNLLMLPPHGKYSGPVLLALLVSLNSVLSLSLPCTSVRSFNTFLLGNSLHWHQTLSGTAPYCLFVVFVFTLLDIPFHFYH